jgi:hypothetical protein
VVPVRDHPPADRRVTVLVPGRGKERATALFDDRFPMRHYEAAVAAITRTMPDARVLLRPHPAEGQGIVSAVARRFPDTDVGVDTALDLEASLAAVDVCIGTSSTITFQSALAGTPVLVLNVSGYEWGWPLGGTTRVPIAHSADELAPALAQWRAEGTFSGREELLEALGATGEDASLKLLELLNR